MAAHMSQAFGLALCKYFGLPPGKVMENMKVNTAHDEIFSATITITLDADDLAGIANEMRVGKKDALGMPIVPQPMNSR